MSSLTSALPGVILSTFGFLVSVWSQTAVAATQATPAVQWQRWEAGLTAQKAHARPYDAVAVDVSFFGPEGKTFVVPAFWDGERGFRVRAAFPSPGRWRWRSACEDSSDTGLHGQSGVVEVSAYAGDNPLFRHGDLRVSDNRRYLVHADGTPFLWLGDTGWNAVWKTTPAEWRDYVDTRARQRFSVLQVIGTAAVPRSEARETPQCGRRPFTPEGVPDPVYWRDLDEKIAHANGRGLFVMLTGLGKSRAEYSDQQGTLAFARYVAGRLAGDMVVLSPSMDDRIDPLNEAAGARLSPLTSHLVVQHPGTHQPTAQHFHAAEHTAFAALQTGHHAGRLDRVYGAAHEWTVDLWQRRPVKPVINVEPMYDALGHDRGPAWRGQDVRKLGWISWLSGSCGYTYGAGDVPPKVPGGGGGIWRFQEDPAAYDHWRKALLWPSAGHMTHLRDFFAALEWWRLEPAVSLVLEQPDDVLRRMAASRTAAGDLLVAYLPDNQEIVLDLNGFPAGLSARWFNPVTAATVGASEPPGRDARATFRRPDGWADAVLVMTADRPLPTGAFRGQRL